jgi:hypothetical protein
VTPAPPALPDGPYLLHGVELASGLVYGPERAVPALRPVPSGPGPRQAIEVVLLRALHRPPCVIGFSGGRDSSGLLALACDLARRHRLDGPVAATNVFAGDVAADETAWQELVVAHAGPLEWERLRFTDELDVVGPYATPLLRRFGVAFPFNGHFGMAAVALARGGTYVTGVGGDELFEHNDISRLARILTGHARPNRHDLRVAVGTCGPHRLRVRHYRDALPPEPWLRPEVAAALRTDVARVLAGGHLWFCDQVRDDVWRDRSRRALESTLAAFAATEGVAVVHPYQDPAVLAAVADARGRSGWADRGAAMTEIFGPVLPAAVATRRTKATFDTVFFHAHSRAFAARWSGGGIDDGIVDVEALRRAWAEPSVDPRTLSLLQQAWCHDHGERS